MPGGGGKEGSEDSGGIVSFTHFGLTHKLFATKLRSHSLCY